jgi:hypothetical protein
MLLTPRIGADRGTLVQQLLQVETDLKNVRSHGHSPIDLFQAYLNWANTAVRLLRHSLREADLDLLVLTKRYWTIQAMATEPVGLAGNLVEVEIDDRSTVFEEARRTTEAEFKRWDERGRLVVADTSFFHQHSEKLDEADLSKVIGSREAPINLVIPIVVIDELEKQKNASQKELRWRSAVTLAVIERVAGDGGWGRLREADFSGIERGEIPSGEHWVDILFDLPGHVRLSINDDEIVDRALAVQLLSGNPVTFLTYDTNQALRARHAGIETVMKLRKEQDEWAR